MLLSLATMGCALVFLGISALSFWGRRRGYSVKKNKEWFATDMVISLGFGGIVTISVVFMMLLFIGVI